MGRDSAASKSLQDALWEAEHRLEIEARQQSYGVATEIVKNVITRYGNHESPNLVKYWTEVADGIYDKMKADIEKMTKGK